MDNLQRFYLARLEAAEEFGLHGNIEECLDICWDLRLKSDLAIYTRALVNSALARYAIPEENPDKMKFAREVGVLAQYLLETRGSNERVTWLFAHAAEVMETVGSQMAEYEKAEREREAKEEETATETECEMLFIGGKYRRIKNIAVPRRRPARPIVPFSIEGMYKPFGKPASQLSDNTDKPHESIEGPSNASDLESTPTTPLPIAGSVELPIILRSLQDRSDVPRLLKPETFGESAAQSTREGSISLPDLSNAEDNGNEDESLPSPKTSSDRMDKGDHDS